MSAAIGIVGALPAVDCLFTVEENQPDTIAVLNVAANLVGDLNQQAGGGTAIVGTHETDVAQRVVGLVVRRQDNDAVLFAGKADDKIPHRHGPDGGIGG